MNMEHNLEKYQIRTDLAIDYVAEKQTLKGVNHKKEIVDGITVTNVHLESNNALKKKKGKYITLEFQDCTDIKNVENKEEEQTDDEYNPKQIYKKKIDEFDKFLEQFYIKNYWKCNIKCRRIMNLRKKL